MSDAVELPLSPQAARLVVATVREAIVILQPEGGDLVIGHVNGAFERIFGYASAEVRGRSVSTLLTSDAPDERASMIETAERLPRRGASIVRAKDGADVLVEMDVHPVEIDGVDTAILVIRDVTDYRRLEEIAAAAEVSESVGYFFAGIRHELGNPLNSVKAALTLLADPLVDLPAPRRTDYLRRALVEVQRMEGLLEQLRTFNAHETVVHGPVLVQPFLERFLRIAREDCAQRGATLALEDVPAATVIADARLLHQILLLLLANALDALEGRADRRIFLGCQVMPRATRITLRDTGGGMTREQLANAQRPFVTTKSKGTGLGLPLAHRYAALNRSRLEIESEPGVGTVCAIQFDRIDSIGP